MRKRLSVCTALFVLAVVASARAQDGIAGDPCPSSVTSTPLFAEGWSMPDAGYNGADGLIHHMHAEPCVPVQKSIDHTNALINIPVNIIFFRQAGAYPKQLTVSLSPDGAANTIANMNLLGLTFSCSNAKLGQVCKASVTVPADLSNAKC